MSEVPDNTLGELLSFEDLADGFWLVGTGMFAAPLPGPDTIPNAVSPNLPTPPERKTQRPDDTDPEDDDTGLDSDMDDTADQNSSETPKEEPAQPLAVPDTSAAGGPQTVAGRGVTLRTPAAHALPAGRELARALRPLVRRVPSAHRLILDEAATVDNIARLGYWLPAFQPDKERWLELAIVVDQHPSMVVWQPAVQELRKLCESLGAFRDVRLWRFNPDEGLNTALCIRRSASPRSARELVDVGGRRAILVISDCIADGWRNGSVAALFQAWRQWQPAAILQMLPPHLWVLTALRDGVPLRATAAEPGMPSARNCFRETEPGLQAEGEATDYTAVPILTCEPRFAHAWARLLAGTQRIGAPAYGLPLRPTEINEPAIPAELSAETRVRLFRTIASELAVQLATLLSAAPLRLPVMRLVQQACLPQSRQAHLAEVILGGLLRRRSGHEDDPENLTYEFHEGVRDLFLNATTFVDARRVQEVISHYLEERFGQSLDFNALLLDPTNLERVNVRVENEVFAHVAAHVLRRMGGNYADLANRLTAMGHGKDGTLTVTTRPGRLAGKHILWVDDEPQGDARPIAELHRMQARVTVCHDTEQAMSQVLQHRPDAIISDLRRGEDAFAGFTLLDRLRQLHHATPLVIYAARRAERYNEQALLKGALACTATWRVAREAVIRACLRPPDNALEFLPAKRQAAVRRLLLAEKVSPARIAAVLEHPEIPANWNFVWGRKQLTTTLCRLAVKIVHAATASPYQQVFVETEEGLMLQAAHISPGLVGYDLASPGGIIGRAVSSRRTVFVPEVRKDPQYIAAEPSTRSELAIPLQVPEQKALGALNVESPLLHAFGARQIMWLEALVASLAQRLQRVDNEVPAPPHWGDDAARFWMEVAPEMNRHDLRILVLRAACRALPLVGNRLLMTPLGSLPPRMFVELAEALCRQRRPEAMLRHPAVRMLHHHAMERLFADPPRDVREAPENVAFLLAAIAMDLCRESSSRPGNSNLFSYCAEIFHVRRGGPRLIPEILRRGLLIDLDRVRGLTHRPAAMDEIGPLYSSPKHLPPAATGAGRPTRMVLVAGAARPSGVTAEMARQIGAALASGDIGLITGGWPGVDEQVAESYRRRLALRPEVSADRWHLEIVDPNLARAFPRRESAIPAESTMDAVLESVRRADAVVLLPGSGGTRMIAEAAAALGRPLIQFGETSGTFPRELPGWSLEQERLELAVGRSHSDEFDLLLLPHLLRKIWRQQPVPLPLLAGLGGDPEQLARRLVRSSLPRSATTATWHSRETLLLLGNMHRPLLMIEPDPAPYAVNGLPRTGSGVCWRPRGDVFATWGPDAPLRFGGLFEKPRTHEITGVAELAWSPDGREVAVIDSEKQLQVIAFPELKTVATWSLSSDSHPLKIVWLSNGASLGVVFREGHFAVYRVGNHHPLSLEQALPRSLTAFELQDEDSALGLSEGRLVGFHRTSNSWRTEDLGILPTVIRNLAPAPRAPFFAAYLPRERRVAIFWNKFPGRPVLILEGAPLVRHLAWSKGNLLAVVRSHSVDVWRIDLDLVQRAVQQLRRGSPASFDSRWWARMLR